MKAVAIPFSAFSVLSGVLAQVNLYVHAWWLANPYGSHGLGESSVRDDDNASGPALFDFPVQNGTTLTWQVNIEPGTNLRFRLSDSNGSTSETAPAMVQFGTSTSCLARSVDVSGITQATPPTQATSPTPPTTKTTIDMTSPTNSTVSDTMSNSIPSVTSSTPDPGSEHLGLHPGAIAGIVISSTIFFGACMWLIRYRRLQRRKGWKKKRTFILIEETRIDPYTTPDDLAPKRPKAARVQRQEEAVPVPQQTQTLERHIDSGLVVLERSASQSSGRLPPATTRDFEEGQKELEEGGGELWGRDQASMELSTPSETPTLPIIAAESLEKAATSPEHTRTKINAQSHPTAQKPTSKLSWWFSGSLNTNTTSAKLTVTVLTPILTSTLPSPRTPASSHTPDKIRPAGLAF
ncbi:hypothetical protein WG66_013664 [Moniliophthora roreri]|nr:hypothetical protein WG66_013664 [Moniliophthora roreri]